MTTKNIQDVVAELEKRYVKNVESEDDGMSRYHWAELKEYTDWLTTTLTQLVKEVKEGEREELYQAVLAIHESYTFAIKERFGSKAVEEIDIIRKHKLTRELADLSEKIKALTSLTSEEPLQDKK